MLDEIFLKRFYLFIFREKGREGETEGEKHQHVVASHVPLTGDLACNPAYALTGNQTSDTLVFRLELNPLSNTSQGVLDEILGKSHCFYLLTLSQ